MVGEEMAVLHFDRVVNYAIRVADRYQRNVTLVMLSAGQDGARARKLLAQCARSCDEVMEFHACAAVLMGETDEEGALHATERYKRVHGSKEDMRFGMASFPKDGQSATSVFRTAFKRMNKACEAGPGTVVYSD
ncbi:MAG: hypothetical protein K1Y02_12840 [Candidatus Hydrogenedentes bacterium]|nr:hypothetical protein [Candidatus Hydrogenedentota bacterium]